MIDINRPLLVPLAANGIFISLLPTATLLFPHLFLSIAEIVFSFGTTSITLSLAIFTSGLRNTRGGVVLLSALTPNTLFRPCSSALSSAPPPPPYCS